MKTMLTNAAATRWLLAVSIFALGCIPAYDVKADVNDLGFYLGGRLLPAFATVEDESLSGGRGGSFGKDGDDFDTTAGVGLRAGYHWNKHGWPIRTDIEYIFRFRNDFDTTEQGDPKIGYKNDLQSHALLFSAYYDFATGTPWRPYVGAGIGWARNSSETTRESNDNSVAAQTLTTDTDNFAYSVQLGARVAISDSWVGDLGYRYVNMGEVESGRFSSGAEVTGDTHVSHDIVLGLVFLF